MNPHLLHLSKFIFDFSFDSFRSVAHSVSVMNNNTSISPLDSAIIFAAAAAATKNLAVITGEIPAQFIGTGEFRANVSQDGRDCAKQIWLVNPDGTGAGLPSGRNMVPLQNRNHSAYCRITEGRSAIRIIIPAIDCWSSPVVIYAQVATEAETLKIRACYE
jgi:hypothetical protein